ncbi:MAG: FtsQ-type POTRA domain-containing protein [Epulopiscium sp.]|nr:FtsQ-type POTRA domain-containing protein [Candidatus Epulonipiscium sp.]
MGKMIPFPKKKSKRTLSISILSMIISIATFFSIILISPIFTLKQIEVLGNERYSIEEILDRLHIQEGMNVFGFIMNNEIKKFKNDPYIEKIDIKLDFPHQVQINIIERKAIGYVPYMGAYLSIDKDGRVLETTNQLDFPLPLVVGLQFQGFSLGDILIVEQEEIFDVILKISQTMFKYDILDKMVKIDINSSKDIQLQIGNIHVLLGGIQEYDYKIRALLQILKYIPKEDKGFLDLSDTSKPFVFKYLT